MPQIRVLLGFQQGQVFSLSESPIIIGRDPQSDIMLHPESAASRRHAEVYAKSGGWSVRDFGSVNGTLLNGRFAKDELLGDKDEIVIGDNVFVFEDTEASVAETEAAASRAVPSESRSVQNRPEVQTLVHTMSQRIQCIEAEIAKAIVGRVDIVREILTAILCRGHILLEGIPALGKAQLVRTIAEVLDLRFKRIQLTPASEPSDIIGRDALRVDEATGKKEIRFAQGPIFTHILLANEISRTPTKTQNILLDAMQENRVTAAGQTFSLEHPFFVLATQSDLTQDGPFPLSQTQLDRFLFSARVDYLSEKEEETLAKKTSRPQNYTLQKMMKAREIIELQNAVSDLTVSDHVIKYAVRLVRATRPADDRAPDFVKKHILCGAGPGAAHHLILGAKARAVIAGHLLVTAQDVRSVALAVLRHRIFPKLTAEAHGMNANKVVEKLIETIEEPEEKDY